MGTTRMDDDLRRGAVDHDSVVQGIASPYVTGFSLFPTVGYANPLLTVGALAILVADHSRVRYDG